MSIPALDRLLFTLMALAWLTLGHESQHTPMLSQAQWVLLSCVPAGASAAVAVYFSRSALRTYLAAVLVTAAARSVAYASEGSWNPAVVWLLFGMMTLLVYACESRQIQ